MKKRIADIIAQTVADAGVKQVFMITGGGAMHLDDAFGREKRLKLAFNHHEQACSFAAEAYCRFSGRIATLCVTSGPGGVNAMNGVYGAYVDSIGMLVISGQIKRETMARNYPIPLRQLGDQEIDIVPIVRTITKYAVVLQDPIQAKTIVQKAIYIAEHGRPGPVWIDVPLDIQGLLVEENDLPEWQADKASIWAIRGDDGVSQNTLSDFSLASEADIKSKVDIIFEHLKVAKRPVLFGGTGVRISGCTDMFRELAKNLSIPTVTGWNAHDIIPNNHPCYAGKPGTLGDRPGNFTVQSSDFLLTLGCRLNIRQISYAWDNFADKAWKAQIDVDSAELDKPTLHNNLILHADLHDVMPLLVKKSRGWIIRKEHKEYLAWCKERVADYPVLTRNLRNSEVINPYHFISSIFDQLKQDEVIVTANGSACVIGFQTAKIQENTRLFTNSGDASMGYELPAAIGVVATGKVDRVICLAGDGSIMMNLQELATIAGKHLPIIVFIINNNGYVSMRQTMGHYFADNVLGIDPASGVPFPDFRKVAAAFDIPYLRINSGQTLVSDLSTVLTQKGPFICECKVDPNQPFEPKLVSKKLPDGTMVSPVLDDMAPFLSEAELSKNRLR